MAITVVLELLVLSVALAGAYQGQMLLRRAGRAQRTYAFMLLGNGLVALVAYLLLREKVNDVAEPLSVVAIGAFVFLVMVPPVLRDLARRMMEGDHLGLALRLLSARELLQPGLGARQEREDVEMFAAVKAGRTADMLNQLRARRLAVEEEPALRAAVDERIVLLFLYARQWGQAIEHFERTLGQGMKLGSPQLLVELVRAYLEEGNVDRGAELLDLLERSPLTRQAIFLFLLTRARMVFLAFMGRVGEVELLLAPAGPLGTLPAPVRAYWVGVARYHAGDGDGARAALGEAVRLGERDLRYGEIAREKLAALDAAGEAPPAQADRSASLEAFVEQVAALVRQPPPPTPPAGTVPRIEGSLRRLAPVTTGIVIANVLVMVALVIAFGWSAGREDVGVLSLVGGNIAVEVSSGAWWRLHASTFLHAGLLHLGMNLYMLSVLGKLVEQIFGGWRMFALYSVSGVMGALASHLHGHAGVSVGASGAVFGVLGAAIAELALRRRVYPEMWRRVLLEILLFVALALLAIGFAYQDTIDQYSHLGGLLAGGLLGVLFSRRASYGSSLPVRLLAGTLVVASVLSLAFAAWGVTRNVSRTRWKEVALGGVALEVPPLWVRVGVDRIAAPYSGDADTLWVLVEPARGTTLDAVADGEAQGVLDAMRTQDRVSRVEATPPTVPAPLGWQVRQHRVEADLGEDDRTAFHHMSYVSLQGDAQIVLRFLVPEKRLSRLASEIPRIVASARRAP